MRAVLLEKHPEVLEHLILEDNVRAASENCEPVRRSMNRRPKRIALRSHLKLPEALYLPLRRSRDDDLKTRTKVFRELFRHVIPRAFPHRGDGALEIGLAREHNDRKAGPESANGAEHLESIRVG